MFRIRNSRTVAATEEYITLMCKPGELYDPVDVRPFTIEDRIGSTELAKAPVFRTQDQIFNEDELSYRYLFEGVYPADAFAVIDAVYHDIPWRLVKTGPGYFVLES